MIDTVALETKVNAHAERIVAVETKQDEHDRRLDNHGKSIRSFNLMGWSILIAVVINILQTALKR